VEHEAIRASSTGTVAPKDRKPVEEVSWPSVSVNGILRATDGVHYAATASINGQGHVLRPGVRSGPFMVRSITRETVVLELDGIQKEYRATAPL
jgi:hypothetical protein